MLVVWGTVVVVVLEVVVVLTTAVGEVVAAGLEVHDTTISAHVSTKPTRRTRPTPLTMPPEPPWPALLTADSVA